MALALVESDHLRNVEPVRPWKCWPASLASECRKFRKVQWILFGRILLVVPGIVLTVRYAFIDAVVVLEGAGGDRARRRTAELTRGCRWQVFLAGLLFFVTFVPLSFAIRVPYEQFFPAVNTMATDVAADCVLDMAYAILQIVIFLYYWQATERAGAEPEPGLAPLD